MIEIIGIQIMRHGVRIGFVQGKAVFLDSEGSISVVVAAGDIAPGTGGGTYWDFRAISINDGVIKIWQLTPPKHADQVLAEVIFVGKILGQVTNQNQELIATKTVLEIDLHGIEKDEIEMGGEGQTNQDSE